MKVYELMNELQKAPAGAEVVVGMCATLNAGIVSVDTASESPSDGRFGQVIITGGDAEVINEEGDSLGNLSDLASAEDEE